MNNGINLISSKHAALERQARIVRIFNRIAYSSLGIVAIGAVGLFFLNFYSPLPKLEAQQQATTQQLLSQKEKIAKLLLLRNRLQNITTLFQHSTSLDKTLTAIALNTPGDVSVDTLGIDETGVNLIVTSPSLLSINSFLDFLKSQVDKKSLFKKITISSLAVDVANGRYSLAVSATPL